jgi:hypothetical protein
MRSFGVVFATFGVENAKMDIFYGVVFAVFGVNND